MDQEGDAAVDEIASRIGRHRCRRVILPRKDLNECLTGGVSPAEIRLCFENARALDPEELQRAGTFTDDVVDLFWPAGKSAPGYSLPFAKVADKLGFRPGELTLWTGASGAGKSQLLSHACVDFGAQGARLCIASLEMAPRQLLRRMVKQAANVDRPTTNLIREIMAWLDRWLWLYAYVGKASVANLLEVFDYARCRYGCDVFVIDSLMRLGIGPDDYEAQEKAIFEITSWAVSHSVHIHLVAHARKAAAGQAVPETEDVKGTSEIAANAFNILAVWRNRKVEDEIAKAADGGKVDFEAKEELDKPTVILNIAKQRNGDWEGKIGLWFDKTTYQYRGAHDAVGGRRYVPKGTLLRDADGAAPEVPCQDEEVEF
jgi:twinkle protein